MQFVMMRLWGIRALFLAHFFALTLISSLMTIAQAQDGGGVTVGTPTHAGGWGCWVSLIADDDDASPLNVQLYTLNSATKFPQSRVGCPSIHCMTFIVQIAYMPLPIEAALSTRKEISAIGLDPIKSQESRFSTIRHPPYSCYRPTKYLEISIVGTDRNLLLGSPRNCTSTKQEYPATSRRIVFNIADPACISVSF
ncbi:hypothetical protein Tco_1284195 [Tanacetum coccineum]